SEARLTVFQLLIKRQKFLVAGCHRWSVGTGAPAAGDLSRTRTGYYSPANCNFPDKKKKSLQYYTAGIKRD
ncbi:hypothetical protein, partial [Selenomonas sp. ND2010]|uniref:hypothetical protein n=1 Tax=Selenomonas sp. ND2010 TaxID=1410618 RepID=UPI00051B0F36